MSRLKKVTYTIIVLGFISATISFSLYGCREEIPIEQRTYENCKIVFTSNRDGNFQIYSMNPDGSDKKRLIINPGVGFDLKWSPNGKKIAFTSTHRPKDNQEALEWNKQGVKGASNLEIHIMNSDGTQQKKLTDSLHDDYFPMWSPGGEKMTFISRRDGNDELYLMNSDGTAPKNLTNNPSRDLGGFWSPDGKKILFQSNREGNDDIYVMNSDGTEQKRLTDSLGNDFGACWSPDGKKIVYVSEQKVEDRLKRDKTREIYIMNSDGSEQRRLTNNVGRDYATFWSPDGGKILFESNRDGNPEIYIMNPDGSEQTNLTINPARDGSPSWSPFLPSEN
jgi:Tol biopolymer transport system component